jgi:hypothetical protein
MWKTYSPPIATFGRLIRVSFNCDLYRSVAVFALFCMVAVPTFGQVSVLTQHNDNARTGQNLSETILTTANVNTTQFGKLFALPVDGQVYAQPLYVPGVTINGGVHNVVIIVTEADSVYAYDADSTSPLLLWPKKASMVDAAHGAGANETPLNSSTTTPCGDMQPLIGITGTPVIDPVSKTIYVEAKSTDGVNYFHRLHALDLLTGNEKSPGPVVIAATVSGTGDGSSNGQLVFNSNLSAQHELNRPGLLLLNGTIYIAYGSHCDASPYHGWLFAYDAATFAMKSVYVTTPNGGLGGFWMSGAGVAADSSGNIFIASGNGDFDTTNVPARETGDTIVKLGTTNQILTQLDYFTPENQANMFANDGDLGSGGVLLLPDQPGAFPHILVEAGKAGRIFVINRDTPMTTNNSHYCSGCTSDPEIIEESASGAIGGMFNVPAYWNNTLYFWGSNDVLKSIPVTNGLPDFTHVTGSSPLINFPGAGLSISSNGTSAGTAIVWAINGTHFVGGANGVGPSVLYAYDATNIPTMLYSSAQNAARDAAGTAVKFAVPTVANGKVYVGTSTEVDVYGLLGSGSQTAATPVISPGSETFTGSVMVSMTDTTAGAAISYTTDGSIPPGSATSQTYVTSFTVTKTTVVKAVATKAGFTNSALASATYTLQGAPTISSLSTTSGPVGTPVTITGTNFGSTQGTSTVKFNGTTATVTSWSATSLVTSVPSGATTGNVVVTVGGVASNGVIFTVSSGSGQCPCTIWPGTARPGTADTNEAMPVELGVKFTSSSSGFISGIRFYKGANNTGTHVGNLWSSTGALLARATFTGETASGWQQVNFSSPVAITANTVYVASYFSPTGDFSVDRNYFNAGVSNPPLQALQNGASGPNAVFNYGSTSAFPTKTFQASNYWVDVVFNSSAGMPQLTITTTSLARGVRSVAYDQTLAATGGTQPFSWTLVSGSSLPAGLMLSTGGLISGIPTSPGTTSFTVQVTDSSNPVQIAKATLSIAVAATIWPSTARPGTADTNEAMPVELGVKFTSSSSGFISGIRFYKGANNTGTHVGNLWSSTGALLARATFTGETASGWQQVNFSSPVAITANTVYVASYFSPTGDFSVDRNYFNAGVSNPPLQALQNGASGPNAVFNYGSTSAFPTKTFQASNYWVDVVFSF